MPKLPGADQLGVARPQPNTRIASADLTAVARGAQQLGRGVQQLGSDLSQISQENRQQQGTTEISGANAFYADGVLSSERTIKDGGNYATYGKDFDAQAEKTLQEGAKLISDPRYREKWIADKRVDLANRRQSMLGAADSRQREAYQVNLGNALERDQNIFTDPATPEGDKQASLGRINDSISAAEKTGLLTPKQAQDWRDTYAKGGILKEAELKILNDPTFRTGIIRGGGVQVVPPFPQGTKLPAGMRNNNPGNIKFVGQKTPGILGPSVNTDQGDPQAVFSSPEAGMSAMYSLLKRKYEGGKLTPNQMIAGDMGWTPGNYQAAANVAKNMGIAADEDIGFAEAGRAAKFMRALMLQEHGETSRLYTDKMISDAVGGNVTFDTSAVVTREPGVLRQGNYAGLSPDDRQKLFELAQRTQNQYSVQQRGWIETAVDNAPTAIQNTGAYSGQLPSRDQFMEAYGAEEGVHKYDTFKASVDTSQQVYNFQTMPAEAITQAVAAARPTSSGDDAALEQKQYDVVSRAAAETIKAREADPATYVQQSFPAVRQSWSDASASGDFRAAMAASTAAQQSLGIQNIQPLPKEIAGSAVDAFKKPEISDEDRLNSVAGLVFSTSDPQQRQAVFGQLVKSGLPPTMQGALEASARGDTGAAYRLMQAAIVDPAKLPKSSETKPREVDDAIYASVWAPGEIGDAAYGTSYGDAASLERASVGTELLRKAALIRVSQGQDVDTAVEGAKKDLFGDMTVFSGSGSVNANLPVPKDVDQDRLAGGLEASKASFKAAIEARRQQVLGAPADPFMAQAAPVGLVEKGNIDLTKRPQVKNADGSVSTVRSMSFEEDGREILVPTVSPDGRLLSDDEAINLYRQTGQHLGMFKTGKEADAYAEALHQQQEREYVASPSQRAIIDTATTNRATDIVDSGVFVPVGNGIGMRDPYTGSFVSGSDGNPLVLPLDRIMQMGVDVQSNAANRGISGRYDRAPLEITVTPPAGAGRSGRYSREVQP